MECEGVSTRCCQAAYIFCNYPVLKGTLQRKGYRCALWKTFPSGSPGFTGSGSIAIFCSTWQSAWKGVFPLRALGAGDTLQASQTRTRQRMSHTIAIHLASEFKRLGFRTVPPSGGTSERWCLSRNVVVDKIKPKSNPRRPFTVYTIPQGFFRTYALKDRRGTTAVISMRVTTALPSTLIFFFINICDPVLSLLCLYLKSDFVYKLCMNAIHSID
jgi:hypothetical protein